MLENIEIPVKTTVYKKEIYKLKNISFLPTTHTESHVFNVLTINYKRRGTWVFKFDYRREYVRVFSYTKVKNDTV